MSLIKKTVIILLGLFWLPGWLYAGTPPVDSDLRKEIKALREEINDLNRRVKYLEATDQILELAAPPGGIERDVRYFPEWEMIHPIRPYGARKKIKHPLHYHAPGRYCPICKRIMEQEEVEPRRDELFKPSVSVGGELRVRGERFRHYNPSDKVVSPGFDENQVKNRNRFNVVGGVSRHIIAYVEGQAAVVWGNEETSLNLYQGFVEYNHIADLPLDLRVGRQELFYGSGFVFGAEAFGNGATFDALRLDYTAGDTFRVDLLASKLTEKELESRDRDLFGFYSTFSPTGELTIDLYGFLIRDEENVEEREEKYQIGTRLFMGLTERVGLEIEPMVETGRKYNPVREANDTINAYGGHADLNISLPVAFHPQSVFSYAYASGDVDDTDSQYEEFHGTDFEDTFLYGDMRVADKADGIDLGGARFSGIQSLTAGFSVDPLEVLNVNLDFHDFTAHRAEGVSRRIGGEANLILTLELPEDINLLVSFNQFYPGRGYKQAVDSSKTINYLYLQTEVSF
ncbi:MAG: alginate export family protein [bacterium]